MILSQVNGLLALAAPSPAALPFPPSLPPLFPKLQRQNSFVPPKLRSLNAPFSSVNPYKENGEEQLPVSGAKRPRREEDSGGAFYSFKPPSSKRPYRAPAPFHPNSSSLRLAASSQPPSFPAYHVPASGTGLTHHILPPLDARRAAASKLRLPRVSFLPSSNAFAAKTSAPALTPLPSTSSRIVQPSVATPSRPPAPQSPFSSFSPSTSSVSSPSTAIPHPYVVPKTLTTPLRSLENRVPGQHPVLSLEDDPVELEKVRRAREMGRRGAFSAL
ncbi:hypothetical protein JCM10213_001560 [Rhodosporidiobolus nylandii]